MPSGLAAAVLAVLARDRALTGAEIDAIARLASPDDAVAEVQLDPPGGGLAPVIGFAAAGTRDLLDELASEGATADAAEGSINGSIHGSIRRSTRGSNDRSIDAWLAAWLAAWLDAVAPVASHWGVKLGAVRQVYARGRFEAAHAEALAGCTGLAATLAMLGVDHFAMLGVELGATIARHVGYVVVSGVRAAEALASARGVTGPLAALAPDHALLHLSWELATTAGPFKLDAGPRSLGDALALADVLGLDRAALAARLAALGLGDPSHVGLRVGAPADRRLALYFRITAS